MTGTILIAARESIEIRALAQILELDGCEVVQTESGERALALASTEEIDAFLIDPDIQPMSGLDLCRAIAAMPDRRSRPIIFLVSAVDEDVLKQAFECGCDDFILKPYRPVIVRARLRTNLKRAEYFKRFGDVRRILKQYISKRTLAVMEKTQFTGTLPPPEEQDLAICFTDMRGFTAFSEDTEPTRLFSVVSELLGDQVQIIHEFGGYVDKFGGDGVMAIFEGPDMVRQCCLSALAIIEGARMKDPSGAQEIGKFGIGIHTGRAIIGNIGSLDHLDYSAIGSSVNLAARLCGQAEVTSIAVSKAVRDAVANLQLEGRLRLGHLAIVPRGGPRPA